MLVSEEGTVVLGIVRDGSGTLPYSTYTRYGFDVVHVSSLTALADVSLLFQVTHTEVVHVLTNILKRPDVCQVELQNVGKLSASSTSHL